MSSEIQPRKKTKVIVEDDDQQVKGIITAVVSVVCHDFWNQAPEDVLTEIFIRLPDCRSAARSSTVCRLWHSLISHNPQFALRFKSQHHQHQDRYPPLFPYTIIFRKNNHHYLGTGPQHLQPILQLFSEEWMFLHGKSSPSNYLDFIPSPMAVIKASCNDWLLVSAHGPGSHCVNALYVCNPITKQFVRLPPAPRHEVAVSLNYAAAGYALVCMPPAAGSTTTSRFKVVELLPTDKLPLLDVYNPLPVSYAVTVYCSESRKWERKQFHDSQPLYINPSLLDIVTCNGILYWLEYDSLSDKDHTVVYLDLSIDKRGTINIPSGHSFHFPHRIGVVREGGGELELRFIQVSYVRKPELARLKVWRLNSNNNSWVSVHNKRFVQPQGLNELEEPFVGVYVHPTNGDLVFIVWGKNVFEHNLVDATYTLIDHLPQSLHDYWNKPLFFPTVMPY